MNNISRLNRNVNNAYDPGRYRPTRVQRVCSWEEKTDPTTSVNFTHFKRHCGICHLVIEHIIIEEGSGDHTVVKSNRPAHKAALDNNSFRNDVTDRKSSALTNRQPIIIHPQWRVKWHKLFPRWRRCSKCFCDDVRDNTPFRDNIADNASFYDDMTDGTSFYDDITDGTSFCDDMSDGTSFCDDMTDGTSFCADITNSTSVTSRGKRLSLLFDVVVLLLITTGTPHSHIRACSPSAITHGMPSHMRSGWSTHGLALSHATSYACHNHDISFSSLL